LLLPIHPSYFWSRPTHPSDGFYLFNFYFLLLIALFSSRKESHQPHRASFGNRLLKNIKKCSCVSDLKLRRHAALEPSRQPGILGSYAS
jgi:hypothetical protein